MLFGFIYLLLFIGGGDKTIIMTLTLLLKKSNVIKTHFLLITRLFSSNLTNTLFVKYFNVPGHERNLRYKIMTFFFSKFNIISYAVTSDYKDRLVSLQVLIFLKTPVVVPSIEELTFFQKGSKEGHPGQYFSILSRKETFQSLIQGKPRHEVLTDLLSPAKLEILDTPVFQGEKKKRNFVGIENKSECFAKNIQLSFSGLALGNLEELTRYIKKVICLEASDRYLFTFQVNNSKVIITALLFLTKPKRLFLTNFNPSVLGKDCKLSYTNIRNQYTALESALQNRDRIKKVITNIPFLLEYNSKIESHDLN